MLVADGALVSSEEPTFEKRNDTVDAGKQMLPCGLMFLDLTIMRIALQSNVGRQSVRTNVTFRQLCGTALAAD